jgi:hypothetical protein
LVGRCWKGECLVLSLAPQTLLSTPHTTKEILALARTELATVRPNSQEGETIARTVGILIAAVAQIEADAHLRTPAAVHA